MGTCRHVERKDRIHIPLQTMQLNTTAKKRDTVVANRLLKTVAFSSAILLALLSLHTTIASDDIDTPVILAAATKDNTLHRT